MDWSEWEQSVAAWEDSAPQLSRTPASPATLVMNEQNAPARVPQVAERDWAFWEQSVQAMDRARRSRSR